MKAQPISYHVDCEIYLLKRIPYVGTVDVVLSGEAVECFVLELHYPF